jgi:hypothetical protein
LLTTNWPRIKNHVALVVQAVDNLHPGKLRRDNVSLKCPSVVEVRFTAKSISVSATALQQPPMFRLSCKT